MVTGAEPFQGWTESLRPPVLTAAISPDCCINSYVLVREMPLYKEYFAHWPVRLRFTPSEDELHRCGMRFALLLQHELPFLIALLCYWQVPPTPEAACEGDLRGIEK